MRVRAHEAPIAAFDAAVCAPRIAITRRVASSASTSLIRPLPSHQPSPSFQETWSRRYRTTASRTPARAAASSQYLQRGTAASASRFVDFPSASSDHSCRRTGFQCEVAQSTQCTPSRCNRIDRHPCAISCRAGHPFGKLVWGLAMADAAPAAASERGSTSCAVRSAWGSTSCSSSALAAASAWGSAPSRCASRNILPSLCCICPTPRYPDARRGRAACRALPGRRVRLPTQ